MLLRTAAESYTEPGLTQHIILHEKQNHSRNCAAMLFIGTVINARLPAKCVLRLKTGASALRFWLSYSADCLVERVRQTNEDRKKKNKLKKSQDAEKLHLFDTESLRKCTGMSRMHACSPHQVSVCTIGPTDNATRNPRTVCRKKKTADGKILAQTNP